MNYFVLIIATLWIALSFAFTIYLVKLLKSCATLIDTHIKEKELGIKYAVEAIEKHNATEAAE